MGAQQAFQWAVSHPDFMDVIIPMCGAAKTYPHGKVRLQSVIDIIRADPGFRRGDFDSLTAATKKAWTSHWASWVFSQQWWRLELFKQRADTPEEFIGGMARSNSDSKIKDNLALSKTWINHDVGDTPGMEGDLEKALRSIKAKVWYLPGETDLYFPIEDATYEAQFIDDVVFRPVPSVWGHLACVGANPEDRQFLSEQIRQALAN